MSEPRTFLPLDEHGQVDRGRRPVQLLQHRPGEHDAVAEWTGGTVVTVNGARAVILPGKGGVVGLGDHAKLTGGRYVVEYADGLATRYQPADTT